MNPDLALWVFLVLMAGHLAFCVLVYVTEVWPRRRARDRETPPVDAWLARREARRRRQRF